MLSVRSLNLLRKLLSNTNPMTIKSLSELLHESVHQVRYDLVAIEDWLHAHNAKLVKNNKGILVQVDEGARLDLLDKLPGLPDNNLFLSPDVRVLSVILTVLCGKLPISIQELADLHFVGRTTVQSELDIIQERLGKFGMKLLRRPKHGLDVEGDEFAWRAAILETFYDLHDFAGMDESLDLIQKIAHFPFYKLFEFVEDAERLYSHRLTDNGRLGFVLHLFLIIRSITSGKTIQFTNQEFFQLNLDAVNTIADKVEELFSISLPKSERMYLALHLRGAKFETPLVKEQSIDEYVLEFLHYCEALLGEVLTDDEILFQGLKVHLSSTLERLKGGMPIRNPMVQELKEKYRHLFEITKYACRHLEEIIGVSIPDTEVGFLVMHLGAAMMRYQIRGPRPLRVTVVCPQGLAATHLLTASVKSILLEPHLLSSYSKRDVERNQPVVDLFVSTVPLKVDKPVIIVDPLLTDLDKQKIQQIVTEAGQQEGRGEQPVLKDLLTKDTIQLDAECSSGQEAIRYGGGILVEQGNVDPSYIDAMLASLETNGPYIVIAPGFAMPHARLEGGVHSVGMSLLRLKHPVPFGHKAHDPVSLVLTFASPEPNAHLKALGELSALLLDVKSFQTLQNGTLDQILSLITNLEE